MGLHKSITISFLIVGHTKFAPDWCFGLVKQRFRKCRVDCLDDIVQVVEESAVANHAQLVATQSGDVLVPTYDWAGHFDGPYKQTALRGIKSYHHFKFEASKPGVVSVKVASDGQEKELHLLSDPSWRPSATDLPPQITPVGLSSERVSYLYEKIREYCRPEVQDLVCLPPAGIPTPPSPEAPTQCALPSAGAPTQPSSVPATESPPAKKQRLCSECKKPGHNRRSCPTRK